MNDEKNYLKLIEVKIMGKKQHQSPLLYIQLGRVWKGSTSNAAAVDWRSTMMTDYAMSREAGCGRQLGCGACGS